MKLTEFIACYGSLSPDAFLDHFRSPFLLQLDEQGNPSESVYVLRSLDGSPIVLGRAKTNHCRLSHTSVSNRHARLCPPRLDDEPWILIDDGSSNGTFLNGTQIPSNTPTAVEDRDQLGFGPDTRLQFALPQTFLPTLQGLVATSGQVTEPSLLDRETDEHDTGVVHPHEAQTTKAQVATPGADLVIWCPPFDPVPLRLERPVILGRSAKVSGFVLPDTEVSRQHTELLRREDGIYIRDLKSANGTRVGNSAVGEALTKVLCEEPIFVGPYRLCVRIAKADRKRTDTIDVLEDEATTSTPPRGVL